MSLIPILLLGHKMRKALHYLAVLSVFLYLPIVRTVFPPYNGLRSIMKTTVMQIYFTGVQALLLFLFLSLIQGLSLSFLLSTATIIKARACSIILKEVAPILVAFIILGRSGAAITVELGNMTVLGEIRLLRRMGIDPYRHVIFPRLIGVTTASLFIGLIFVICITLVAGFFASDPLLVFLKEMSKNWSVADLIILAEKSTLYGLIISMVACYQGLNLEPATTEVPKATIRTVIHCIILCTSLNFLFKVVWL